MHFIVAYVRPNLVRKVQAAVHPLGVDSMTLIEVKGMGEQGGNRIDSIQKIKLEMVVTGESVKDVVNAIMEASHTGQPGDGIVFTQRLDGAWRIRTKGTLTAE